MSKPETNFYTSVHKHLPPTSNARPGGRLYRVKTHNPYVAGLPDFWYSGVKRDLWVEYKFIVVPKRDDTIIDLCKPKDPTLSDLQQDWIKSRTEEKRDVWVIVGCKEGGVIMPRPVDWQAKWPAKKFREWLVQRSDVARIICLHCVGTR